jgi:hypothetical protein
LILLTLIPFPLRHLCYRRPVFLVAGGVQVNASAALARSDGALARALSEVNASLALLHDQVGGYLRGCS